MPIRTLGEVFEVGERVDVHALGVGGDAVDLAAVELADADREQREAVLFRLRRRQLRLVLLHVRISICKRSLAAVPFSSPPAEKPIDSKEKLAPDHFSD